MRRLPGIRLLPRVSTTARSIERAVDDEMRFHLQMRVDDLMRQGQSRSDAESQARHEFGDIVSARAELSDIDRRAARRAGLRELVASLAQDIRISMRGLRARPGFTATILLTLALGIGANAAIFSVLDAVLLRPLPFASPNRLVHLWETFDGVVERRSEGSYPDYLDLRDRATTLSGIAGYQTTGMLLGAEHPTTVVAGTVTANFFDVLGVRPVLGRTFATGEDAVGAARVIVLSDGLWERIFARDRAVVGTTVVLDGAPATVIGILPPDFRFGGRAGGADFWTPINKDADLRMRRGAHWINMVGRLRDGASVSTATRELSAIMHELGRSYPRTNLGRSAMAVPLRDELVGSVRPLLLVLYGAVVVVLLVACANVANLLLMRGTDREREMAMRVALGAGRGRLIRQLLGESLLLALVGGLLALVLASFGIRAIIHVIPRRTLDSLPALAHATIDARIAGYAALVSIAAGIVFGLVPAIRATQASIYDLLKQGTRGGGTRGRLRDGLVIAEVALTVILVSGATLFARSLDKLLSIDLGFRTAHVSTAGILLSSAVHADPARSTQVFERLVASTRALPGVESVGLISRLPLNGGETWDFQIAGRPEPEPGKAPSGSIRWVGGDYFQTLGIALRSGRLFSASDDARAPKVVIINESLARRYFPAVNAIGQVIVRRPDSLRVIGVVGDVPISTLDEKIPPTWYVPLSQAPQGFMRIAVRGAYESSQLLRDLSTTLASLDAGGAVLDPATIDELLIKSSSVFTRRFPLLLIGVFAGTALVLALVGIYGVVSYSVGQRRRELGIRMALGAEPRGVIALFLRHAAWMAGIGTLLGVSVALLAARFIAGMLYGVSPSDPATYVGVAAMLSAAAMAATLIPALRATRVDPTITLRAE